MYSKVCWLGYAPLALASFALSSPAQALTVVEGNLLTGSSQNAEWLACGSKAETVNIQTLNEANCAFREVLAVPGAEYRLSCGVTPVDYASMTLSFMDASYNTITREVEEISDGANGGYSIALTAPEGASMAAVTLYGENGTGFQDCALINVSSEQPASEWTIKGFAWLDSNEDSQYQEGELGASGLNVNLFVGDNQIAHTTTDQYGDYSFPGLSGAVCYVVKIETGDASIGFGTPSEVSVVDASGRSSEICPTAQYLTIDWINAAVVNTAVPPAPADSAICGFAWQDQNSNNQFDANETAMQQVVVQLLDSNGNSVQQTTTNANGFYALSGVPAGGYRVKFAGINGFDFVEAGYVDANGVTRQFILPDENNGAADDACTLSGINAGYRARPVALEPTIANNDVLSGLVNTSLQVNVLQNDLPCDESVSEVVLIGHNVNGTVSLNASGILTVVAAAPGVYNVTYGIRGACGSLGQAQVAVTVTAPPTSSIQHCNAVYSPVTNASRVAITRDIPAVSYEFLDANGQVVGTVEEASGQSVGHNGLFFYIPQSFTTARAIRSVNSAGIRSSSVICPYDVISPIALDLNKDGRIERRTGTVFVDMNNDGIDEELMSWFGPSDGILVLGKAETLTGKAVTGSMLFGDEMGKYTDGFDKLSSLDTNDDQAISGDELGAIMVWRDLNSDTIISADELSTLKSVGVVTLAVEHYKYRARATLENGKTMVMEDVWFPSAAPVVAAGR